ncbi:MAG: hypothetical protein V7782_09345 [Psychromonas sp.]
MKILTTINKSINQYKTRQQLLTLPEYLLKDVALTSEDIALEMKKNSLFSLLFSSKNKY